MSSNKKIVLDSRFLKDLRKMAHESTHEDQTKLLGFLGGKKDKYNLLRFSSPVPYLRYWRELNTSFTPSFNKKYTYRLARAYQEVKPCSLFSAKLQISCFKWWDWQYFLDLIGLFDEDEYKQLTKIADLFEAGGQNRYLLEQNEDYQAELDHYFNEMFVHAKKEKDGSLVLGEVKNEKENYPLLAKEDSEESRQRSKEQVAALKKKNAVAISSWLEKHSELSNFFVSYLNAWGHSYARRAYNAESPQVGRQILRAKKNLSQGKFVALARDLLNFYDWWD